MLARSITSRPEIGEVAPAGSAGVDDGGHAGGEGVDVGFERQRRAAVSGEDMGVHVDDAGHDVVTRHVQNGVSGPGRHVRRDRRHPPLAEAHVGPPVDPVGGIDHMAALQQQIRVMGLRR